MLLLAVSAATIFPLLSAVLVPYSRIPFFAFPRGKMVRFMSSSHTISGEYHSSITQSMRATLSQSFALVALPFPLVRIMYAVLLFFLSPVNLQFLKTKPGFSARDWLFTMQASLSPKVSSRTKISQSSKYASSLSP